MDNPLRYNKALLPLKLNASILKIDDEPTFENKEELVIAVVLVPVVLALQNAEANDRVVDLAQRLVVPAVGACLDQSRNIDQAQRLVKDV